MDIIHVPPQPDLELQWELTRARFDEWIQSEFLTPRWWLLLAAMVVTIVAWWIKVDKRRLDEIALYTAFIIIFIIVLDELGEEMLLWYYPVDVIFIFPPTTAINIACMPLVYTLIYQRFGTWRSFIVATVVMSAVFCFVMEPIAVWVGIYTMMKWKSYYGFPIYIFIALISKLAVSRIYSLTARPIHPGR